MTERRSRTYGGRLRIGAIVPPTNAGTEVEFARMAPPGVSTQVTRLPIHMNVSDDANALFRQELAAATRLLAAAAVDVVLYACTVGSIIRTHEDLARTINSVVKLPLVTTARAVVDALQALRLRRVALVSPYTDELNEHEVEFLERHGLEVPRAIGIGIGPERFSELSYLRPEDAERLIAQAEGPDVDGFFLSCTDFASADVIKVIEERFGKPLVTSNQASLWASLRAGGVSEPVSAFGKLLALEA